MCTCGLLMMQPKLIIALALASLMTKESRERNLRAANFITQKSFSISFLPRFFLVALKTRAPHTHIYTFSSQGEERVFGAQKIDPLESCVDGKAALCSLSCTQVIAGRVLQPLFTFNLFWCAPKFTLAYVKLSSCAMHSRYI